MVVDLFLVYQFIRRLATPFNKWDAYEAGVIDDKGNILVKKKDRNSEQKKAFKVFDVMVRNMKRLLAKVPGGSTRLASYAAALYLIREHNAFTEDSLITEDTDEDELEKSLFLFSEAYLNYTTLDERVNGFLSEKLKNEVLEVHPEVVKAYKRTLDADHRHAEYGTTAAKRAATRTANTLSKKIKQHHPDLDMNGKIKLRTQLQNMREESDLQEAQKVRWKRSGVNGEIEATVAGKKYKIEKALDHNLRHKGEWKVMVWDKRHEDWEWETTEYGKANAKAWIMNKLQEEPANNVGSGNIAGMDGSAFSKVAQKKWTSSNKSKKKRLRDIMGVPK